MARQQQMGRQPRPGARPRPRIRLQDVAGRRRAAAIARAWPAAVSLILMLLAGPLHAAVGQPSDPSLCVSITRFGAQSNGGDATAAIQSAINAAKSTARKCVYVPAGTYRMTRFRVEDGVRVVGDGDLSVLFAPNPANRQLVLAGSGGGVYRLKLLTHGTQRTDNNEAIWIDGRASHFVIDSVSIDGGNGAGIITFGGSYGRITRNRVSNTKADSIHMSGGAHHVYIAGNRVRNSGDDMIGVVTYQSQPVVNHEILIENNDLADQPWGRGISVVGGERITIRNNRITRSSDAGVYIAAEDSWNTRGGRNILVTRNRIDQAPHAYAWHGHRSIDVFSFNGFWVEDVALTYNAISNAPNGPIRVRPRNTRNIGCAGNTINGAPVSADHCTGNVGTVTGASVTARLLGGYTVPLPR